MVQQSMTNDQDQQSINTNSWKKTPQTEASLPKTYIPQSSTSSMAATYDKVFRPQRRSTINQKQPQSSEVTINRLHLFATVKILLQFLSKEKPHLRFVAQKVLKDCHKQHLVDKTTTLAELIERRLRETVGEKVWNIAKTIQQRQCSISLKSVNKNKNQREFTVTRGTDDSSKITLIVPLTNNSNGNINHVRNVTKV